MPDRSPAAASSSTRSPDRLFWVGLARAFGGAIFFSLPLLMTMEMWWLGFYMDRVRLASLMILFFPLLVALDYYSGFKETSSWSEDVVDATVAYGVGFLSSLAVLALLGILEPGMPLREIVGKVALQAVPASLGAVLANSQMNSEGEEKAIDDRRQDEAGYRGELLFLATGALFLAFNVAPTEEVILIAFKMTPWHAGALGVVTLLMMHAFVYFAGFRGAPSIPENTSGWSIFLRFTVVGYAIALVVSASVLWTFGRFEGGAILIGVKEALVLGFPAGLGAAAARIIL